jgi:hypothetical protein
MYTSGNSVTVRDFTNFKVLLYAEVRKTLRVERQEVVPYVLAGEKGIL